MLGLRAGLFAANPRAIRYRFGRCGFSAAIPTRKECWNLGLGGLNGASTILELIWMNEKK
jgi:hypothetical protein